MCHRKITREHGNSVKSKMMKSEKRRTKLREIQQKTYPLKAWTARQTIFQMKSKREAQKLSSSRPKSDEIPNSDRNSSNQSNCCAVRPVTETAGKSCQLWHLQSKKIVLRNFIRSTRMSELVCWICLTIKSEIWRKKIHENKEFGGVALFKEKLREFVFSV